MDQEEDKKKKAGGIDIFRKERHFARAGTLSLGQAGQELFTSSPAITPPPLREGHGILFTHTLKCSLNSPFLSITLSFLCIFVHCLLFLFVEVPSSQASFLHALSHRRL